MNPNEKRMIFLGRHFILYRREKMETYKKLFAYVPEKKHLVWLSMLLAAIAAVLAVLPFWYLWQFFEDLIVDGNIIEAKQDALYMIGLMIANIIVYFLGVWSSHIVAFRLEGNLRKAGAKHLLDASFAFFDQNNSGRIRKIIDDNAAQTHMLVAHLIPDLVTAVMKPLLMFLLIFVIDVRLGILMLVMTGVGVVDVKFMMGNTDFMKAYSDALEKMNAEAVEYVRGMQVVKIFRGTLASFKNFHDTILFYSKFAFEYSKSCRKPYVFFQVLFNLIIAITIPFAIFYMNAGAPMPMVLAKIVFFACFSGMFFDCFMKIMYTGMYQFQAQQVVEKLETLFQDMNQKTLVYGNETEMQHHDIAFKNVTFRYDRDNILENVSFTLAENKVYALVGASGSGKSTIAKLMSGFYALNEGEICIGGKPLTAYREETIVENIAFVFQHAKLFKKTIYENVLMGNPNATHEAVMKALEDAQCNSILDKFPSREYTMIGAEGVHLSGGEMQRIAIARALLKDAAIIILDEASAAADPENEYEIQQAFSKLMAGKTVIMIAHRLSAIRNVDEILVVDKGHIVERGSHRDLMAQQGRYHQLAQQYAQVVDWRAI